MEQAVGHPRPSLSGTGAPWVSCLDLTVCPRVQDDPEAKSHSVVVDVKSVTAVRMTVARQSLNRAYSVPHQNQRKELRRHKLKGS